jgi:hypothetical protein
MKFLRVLAKPSIIQPILSVVLILMLVLLIFQFVDSRNGAKDSASLRQLSRKVTFDDAVNKYLSGTYESYTRGSLLVKNASLQSTESINPQNNSTQPTSVTATENKFDDLFFIIDKGNIRKLDLKTFGQNESLFFNDKGEIVFLSNTDKSYSVYPVPAEGEKDAELLFTSTKQMMQDLYPLVAVIRDYKDGKFNPVERAANIYSGKWQHVLFTSNEIVDVYLETNPTNGLFTSITITHQFTSSPSAIYFDFKDTKDMSSALQVPSGYKNVELKTKYKAKA